MQKYKTLSTLGDGAFGTVYKATNIKTGEIVAIKKMKQKYTSWNQCVQLRQIKSLRKFNHPNIMKLKEVLLVAEQLYMVFEYLDYNIYEVYAKMKEGNKKFTSIVYQIANGLAHVHKNGFFHRDLKPENILIYNNVVKVCDFGLARQIRSRPPFTDYVSTRWYRAPELLLRSTTYNSPVDIFALGCIMAQLYTLTPLFPGTNQIDQMNKIVKILGTPNKNDWPQGYKMAQSKNYYFPEQPGINISELIPQACPQAIQLIQSMLRYSSRKRITAAQILKHEYFKNVILPNLNTSSQLEGKQNKQIAFQQKKQGTKLDTLKQDKKIDVFRMTKQKFKQTRNQQANQNNPLKQYENMRLSKLVDNNSNHKYEDDKRDRRSKQNDMNQLDSLIQELQQKGKGKKGRQDKNKLQSLPALHNNGQNKQLLLNYKVDKQKEKDQQYSSNNGHSYNNTQPLKMEKDQWKLLKTQQNTARKKQVVQKSCRSEIHISSNNKNMYANTNPTLNTNASTNSTLNPSTNKLFSYSFQPANIPAITPPNNHIFGSIIRNPPAKQNNIGYLPLLPKTKSILNGPVYKY